MKCKECGKETKNPKFCSRSCATKFNNCGVSRNVSEKEIITCLFCKTEFESPKYKKRKYCSLDCWSKHMGEKRAEKSKKTIEDWLCGKISGSTGTSLLKPIRLYIIERDKVCQICGVGDTWNGKTLSLQVDHIDGIWSNNSPENLRTVCPNCHSQTSTYGSKNKGNGRPVKIRRV